MASYLSSSLPQVSEAELYDQLCKYVLPVERLEVYSYPRPDPNIPGRRKVTPKISRQQLQLRSQFASSYTCVRCKKGYQVDTDGVPIEGRCTYHPGKLWVTLGNRYNCCKGSSYSTGCTSGEYHVHEGELELKNYEDYVSTEPKPEREPKAHGIFALDCEMSFTTYGLEVTRVVVLNYRFETVYESLVKPANKILDYNTFYTGIRKGDLDCIDTSLADVQRRLLDIFSSKSILIGHGMDNDMNALKIFHEYNIDTVHVFPHRRGLPYKRALKTLVEEKLGASVQGDTFHDSKEDAAAAYRLVLWKLKSGASRIGY